MQKSFFALGRPVTSGFVTPIISALLIGCAGGQSIFGGSSGGAGEGEEDGESDAASDEVARARGEATVSVRYGKTAKENWELGEEEYRDENYLAAQKYFGHIRNKYPYSAYALRAELRVGDCLFARGRFLEAIDAFQNYVRIHPTHNKVPYAMYRIGAAHFEQIPGDWFLIPPSHEKDQAAVRDTERSLQNYVQRYPNDENAEAGKKLLQDVQRRLADHERYVADFYRNEEKPKAYVGRLEVLRKNFSDVALDDGLLLEIITVYAELQDHEGAHSAFDELGKKYPKSPNLDEAKKLVGTIPVPPPKAAVPEPPAETGSDESAADPR